MSDILAAQCVARGAALLDVKRPGWHHNISLNRLRTASTEDCILGQLFGNYSVGIKEILDPALDNIFNRGYHGFTAHDSDEGEFASYGELDRAWKGYIRSRRGESPSVTSGDYRYTVVEAIRLGRQVRETGDVEALIDLLVTVSGGDADIFRAIFG